MSLVLLGRVCRPRDGSLRVRCLGAGGDATNQGFFGVATSMELGTGVPDLSFRGHILGIC